MVGNSISAFFGVYAKQMGVDSHLILFTFDIEGSSFFEFLLFRFLIEFLTSHTLERCVLVVNAYILIIRLL